MAFACTYENLVTKVRVQLDHLLTTPRKIGLTLSSGEKVAQFSEPLPFPARDLRDLFSWTLEVINRCNFNSNFANFPEIYLETFWSVQPIIGNDI